jgi:opacity protein-like surface antigen
MLKKLYISAIVLTTGLSSVAATANPYVGLGAGFGSKSGMNISGGYGERLANPNFYLAGELFVNNLTAKRIHKMSYGIGASIIPGVYINPTTIAYTRLGIENLHNGNVNTSKTGAHLGLGMQTNLTKTLDVRGEYAYLTHANNKQFSVGLVYNIM